MALVDHHQRVVLLGQGADFVERSGVAVHREDAVGDDDAEALRLGALEALLQFGHVGVGVAVAHGLAQTHAVDDGGVVEGVGDDGVLLGEERLEDTAVGVEAGGVENRILGAEEVGDGLFELLVDVLAAADEADGGHAEAAGVHRALGRLNQTGVVREAEVVVCTEIQYLATADLDFGALGRTDDAFVLVEARGLDVGELLLQMGFDFSVHDSLWF